MRVVDCSLIIVGADTIFETGPSIQSSSYAVLISPLLTLRSDNRSLTKPVWEKRHSVFCIGWVRMSHLSTGFSFRYVIRR